MRDRYATMPGTLMRKEFEKVSIPTDVSTCENAHAVRQIFFRMANKFAASDFNGTTYEFRDHYSSYFANGMTGFFRHRGVMQLLTKSLYEASADDSVPIRIFAAPSSVGCEAYTLSAFAHWAGIAKERDFRIDALDRSENFTALARIGAYPWEMTDPIEDSWHEMLFATRHDSMGMVSVREDVKSSVRFLDAQNIENFRTDEHYDAVMMNNLFYYLDDAQKKQVVENLERMTPDIIITTKEEYAPIGIPESLPYIPLHEHPAWQDTSLCGVSVIHNSYHIWARKEPSPNYAL